ncbi:unnamed protein product [Caenorhabditis angaria]|uniref:Uncharacterized protein n=1 Tax=Caenorhabditis angaria TaxID=860376 RepID=A0A9P1IPC9_9PELO|nr:unnamed protein product [Caenorhabditis angaria]
MQLQNSSMILQFHHSSNFFDFIFNYQPKIGNFLVQIFNVKFNFWVKKIEL